jgi:Family of unknown function (DUF5723)
MHLFLQPAANTMRIQLYFLLFALFIPGFLAAQMDLSSHFLQGTWQAYQTNPALLPKNRITIALPSVYGFGQFSGFKLGDLFQRDGQVLNWRIDEVIDNLGESNFLQGRFDINTLGLGFHVGDWYLSAGHSMRQQAYFEYPKELAQFLWRGNAPFIGREVQLAPQFAVRGSQELYFGISRKLGENLSVGARFKVINGYTDLSSSSRDLRLTTSDDIYQLGVKANYILNGTADILRYDNLGNARIKLDTLTHRADWTSNTGYGMDLGINYQLERLQVSAGINDIGQINWRDNVNNIRIQGDFTFNGLNVLSDFLTDSLDLGVILDTLEANLGIQQSLTAYVSPLPSQYYISARVALNEGFWIGALAYADRIQGAWYPAFGFSAHARLGNVLSLGGMYIIRNGRFDNLGANAALTLGPVQLALATDNLLTLVNAKEARAGSIRAGLNLVLGNMERVEKKKGKPLPSGKKFF